MSNHQDTRLYLIESQPGHFFAGHLKNGNQLLMSVGVVGKTKLVAVEFDASGNYLRTISQEFSQNTLREAEKSNWSGWDTYWLAIDEWVTSLGMTKGTIAVKKFDLPDLELSIQDVPDEFEDVLNNGDNFDETTIQDMMELIKE